jgi:hypothetical protein
LHKNVLAFIFLPSTAPRRAAPPRLSLSCAASGSPVPAPPPALPFLRRLRLSRSCAASGSPVPAPPPALPFLHCLRLSRSCTAPALPLLRRLRLSRACRQARAPALISSQFYFFDPPLLFPPGPRGSEKTPSYLPNFCALEPAKLNVRARSTYRARAGAGAYRRV